VVAGRLAWLEYAEFFAWLVVAVRKGGTSRCRGAATVREGRSVDGGAPFAEAEAAGRKRTEGIVTERPT
jgi:hypothetical protein